MVLKIEHTGFKLTKKENHEKNIYTFKNYF